MLYGKTPPNTACSGWWVRAAFPSRLLAETFPLRVTIQPLPPPLTQTVGRLNKLGLCTKVERNGYR